MTYASDLAQLRKTGKLTIDITFNDVGLVDTSISSFEDVVSEEHMQSLAPKDFVRLYRAEREVHQSLQRMLDALLFPNYDI